MRAFGKNAEMSQVIAGEVKGREMFGHAIAGFGQNLIFGLWSNYMLVFYTCLLYTSPSPRDRG